MIRPANASASSPSPPASSGRLEPMAPPAGGEALAAEDLLVLSSAAGSDPAEPKIPEGARRYTEEYLGAQPEPTWFHGLLFMRYPRGHYRILKEPGTTRPDVPPSGIPDIPDKALKDNRLVLSVNGIHQTMPNHLRDIARFLQAPDDRDAGANVGQPVVGVHQAVGKTHGSDVARMVGDVVLLKFLQGRTMPLSWLKKVIYKIDGAVKTTHDQLRQSMQLGRDVAIVAHSGGGTEAALALTLLAREDGGRYREAIGKHVRVLGLASASARGDFELAGVKPEHIVTTGSVRDPVDVFGRKFISPGFPLGAIPGLGAMLAALLRYGPNPTHALDYIFAANARPDGTQPLQQFLDGAPGGDYILA